MSGVIRYRYAAHTSPPAPFANVTVVCPATAAQLDPGADRTVLPGRVVASLGLVEDGRLKFQGFAGTVVELPTFLIELRVETLPAVAVRAVVGDAEPWVLLGRDVLNQFRVVLDGPVLVLDIG